MLRIARAYVFNVEKELNQIQAYVIQLRDEASSVRAVSAAGGSSAAFQSNAADALELRICEIRGIFSSFKETLDFKRKKELQEEIEKRLNELKSMDCIKNRMK